jgi:hypothetical protein
MGVGSECGGDFKLLTAQIQRSAARRTISQTNLCDIDVTLLTITQRRTICFTWQEVKQIAK